MPTDARRTAMALPSGPVPPSTPMCTATPLHGPRPQVDSAAAADLQQRWGRLDGLLHAIGFAPPSCLGGGFMDAPWDDVSVAMHVSAYSLKALAAGMLPLFRAAGGGAVVGLDFDATVAWP